VIGLMLLKAGRTIYSRAYGSLFRQRRLTIDSMDATAVTLLMAQGSFTLAGILVTLITSADYIRAHTQEKSRKAMTEVLDHFAHVAWVVRDGQEVLVPVEKVRVGDTVVVYPGERMPVDGIVLSGRAFVDQHALTGESMPVEKRQGELVYAATAVREGQIYLRATHIGDDTQVAGIVQMIRQAPIQDTRIQDYAERFANRIVPFSYLAAGISLLLGNVNQAVTLLVIDYGAALRVAAPTAVLSSMAKAARRGILIRGGRHLEKLAEVDALIFDKTGTLTLGHPEVTHVIPVRPDVPQAKLLALAAAAEQRLSHPVAQAVVEAAKKRALFIPGRSDCQYVIGSGVETMVNGRWVLVGSQRFLEDKTIHFDREAQLCLERIEAHAVSPLCVAVDGNLIGLLGISDPIRPESKSVIQALRERGVGQILMLTGDRPAVARKVAESLGISDYVAEVFPDAKLDAVKRLQARGHTVAVVGDGINDSPALAQAEVGIAVNGGTAVAQEAADVVLLQGDLWKVVEAIDIARESVAIIEQNWRLIIGANTIGLALGFAGRIGPAAASLISDGAAITAGANAVRPMLHDSHHQKDGSATPQSGTMDDPGRPIGANGKAGYHDHQGVVKLLEGPSSQNGRSNANGSSGNDSKMAITLGSG
jgi:heavy metal translocating P-type ATPase